MVMLKNLSLHTYYRYTKMNHVTNISVLGQEKAYTHNAFQNLNLGLRFNF